jgi:hypothetical protein
MRVELKALSWFRNGNKTFLKRLGVSEVSLFFSMYLALRWVYIVSIDSEGLYPVSTDR